jgi:hypothetical protein
MHLSIFFLIILIGILHFIMNNNNALELFINKEHFTPGVFGFQLGVPIQPCNPSNDCFPGNQMRSQIYQNVCQPSFGLNRQPIPLDDSCQRTLGGKMSAPRKYYVCDVNKHLQRKCRWI